jgi:hypothetical protein
MKVQRTRHRHVRFYVPESSALKGTVWTDVESVRLAKQLLDLQRPKIEVYTFADTLGTDPLLAQGRLCHVKMHIRLFAEHDLIATGETYRASVH